MSDEYQVVRDFWDSKSLGYIRVGDPVPSDEATVAKMRELGYLKTQKEILESRNPVAASALSEVERLRLRVAELEAQLGSGGGGDSDALVAARRELKQAQEKQQEAEAARSEALKQLDEYKSAVGELLPEGLNAGARKALIAAGYVGKVTIGLLSDKQLAAVDGVAAASIKALREWAVFTGDADAKAEARASVGE